MSRPPCERKRREFRVAAVRYVNDQLDTMAKYGSAKILSPEEHEKIVLEVQKVGESLWTNSGGKIVD